MATNMQEFLRSFYAHQEDIWGKWQLMGNEDVFYLGTTAYHILRLNRGQLQCWASIPAECNLWNEFAVLAEIPIKIISPRGGGDKTFETPYGKMRASVIFPLLSEILDPSNY